MRKEYENNNETVMKSLFIILMNRKNEWKKNELKKGNSIVWNKIETSQQAKPAKPAS